jgi:hypothetical protein
VVLHNCNFASLRRELVTERRYCGWPPMDERLMMARLSPVPTEESEKGDERLDNGVGSRPCPSLSTNTVGGQSWSESRLLRQFSRTNGTMSFRTRLYANWLRRAAGDACFRPALSTDCT